MSTHYYLYEKQKKHCVNLGKKLNESSFGFEGPLFYSDGEFRLLPEELRHLLKKRFIEAHGERNVVVLTDDDLFDSGRYLAIDEEPVEVGGDEDNAIPLNVYLPELVQTASNKAA